MTAAAHAPSPSQERLQHTRCGRAGRADAVFDDCANCTYTQHTAPRGLNKVRGTWQTMQKTQAQTQTFITDQPRRKPSRKLGRPRRMADSAKCCKLQSARRRRRRRQKPVNFSAPNTRKLVGNCRERDWHWDRETETETGMGMGTVVCLAAPLA